MLVISEELDELFEICDRILVIYEGRLSASRERGDTSVEEIGLLMAAWAPTRERGWSGVAGQAMDAGEAASAGVGST